LSGAGTNLETIPGWEIYKSRATLGVTTIGGWQSSNANNTMPTPSNPAVGSAPYVGAAEIGPSYSFAFSADKPAWVSSGQSLVLTSDLDTSPFGVVHGPYLVSENAISMKAGDTVSFDWRSLSGDDAYDSYAYLLNTDNGNQIELLDAHADARVDTNWATTSVVVPTAGNYKFVFLAGTFDASGGTVAGGSLRLTNIQVTPAVPEPNALRAINIGTGGEFSINQATEINGVWTTGVSSTAAEDGTYRLVADASAGTLTLNQYYDNTPTLTRSETIHQGRATNADESRTFYFEALGVAVSLGNRAKDALWFGNEQSGLTAEIKIAENQRISIDGNAPSFKISDGSKFDIRLDELRDVRLGENDDNENADVFNALNAAVTLLAAHRNPSLESLSDLSGLTKAAIDRISDLRTSLGATSNRLFAAVNSIDSQLFSISSNRNRIESTDYAQETSRLVRLQANQSAYLATLAHMNTQPQMVLWLLQ
jgi:flagellin-like hook-associated protein FlgL